MARRARGEQSEGNTNGRRASVTKMGETVGSERAGQRESTSVGPVNGTVEVHAEGLDHFHQQVAECAFFLYERSGFQDGNALDHWLEAERQVKGLRGQAA